MSESAVHIWTSLVMVAFGALTLLGSYLIQSRSAARSEGALTTRIDTHDRDISRLDREQDEQWSKINENRESVAKIKGKLGINGA